MPFLTAASAFGLAKIRCSSSQQCLHCLCTLLWHHHHVLLICCSLKVITSLMMSLVEPSVQFFVSLEPRFRDFGSTQDISTVGLVQVETFLCMFSTLLNDYFAHGQKKLKPLQGIRVVAQPAMASLADNCSYSTKQTRSSASDDCSALKCLLVLAYIWGFGSSLFQRYFMIFAIFSRIAEIMSSFWAAF